MIIARIIGLLLVLAGATAFVFDLLEASGFEAVEMSAAGELWYRLHPGSLELSQAVIERYLWPPLWNPGIVTILLWPAPLVFAIPGLAILGLVALMGRTR